MILEQLQRARAAYQEALDYERSLWEILGQRHAELEALPTEISRAAARNDADRVEQLLVRQKALELTIQSQELRHASAERARQQQLGELQRVETEARQYLVGVQRLRERLAPGGQAEQDIATAEQAAAAASRQLDELREATEAWHTRLASDEPIEQALLQLGVTPPAR